MNCEKAISQLVNTGNLARLNNQERDQYYAALCETLGLNPLTVPFEYLTLNGKTILYAKKACTDQLRSLYGISVTDLREEEKAGVYCVSVKVQNKDGRTDCDMGTVSLIDCRQRIKRGDTWVDNPAYNQRIPQDEVANAMLKAATKAKRRATLSICGLGMLDETEVETIPGAKTEVATTNEAGKAAVETKSTDPVVLPKLGREAAQKIQRNILSILDKPDCPWSSMEQMETAVKVALEKLDYSQEQYSRLLQPLRYEWYRQVAINLQSLEQEDALVSALKDDLVRSQIGEKAADEILSCIESAGHEMKDELAKLSPKFR